MKGVGNAAPDPENSIAHFVGARHESPGILSFFPGRPMAAPTNIRRKTAFFRGAKHKLPGHGPVFRWFGPVMPGPYGVGSSPEQVSKSPVPPTYLPPSPGREPHFEEGSACSLHRVWAIAKYGDRDAPGKGEHTVPEQRLRMD